MPKSLDEERLPFFLAPRLWWVTFGKIVDKSGYTISPTPTPLQEKIFEVVQYGLDEGLPIRIAVLKPRQAGSSTAINGIFYHQTRARQFRSIWVTNVNSTNEYHRQMMVDYERNDDFPWGNTLDIHSRRMECSNGSTRHSSSAESKNPGVGGAFQGVGSSETAKFGKEGAAKDASIIMPQLKAALAREPGTIGIDESTADGIGYFSKIINGDPEEGTEGAVTLEQWRAGDQGNGTIKIVMGWYDHFQYQIPLNEENAEAERDEIIRTLTKEEKRVIKEQGDKITAERIKWRRWCIKQICGGSEQVFQQEYTEDEQRCFLASGLPRFSMEGLIRVRETVDALAGERRVGIIQEGDTGYLFKDTDKGEAEFCLWEEPEPGRRYIISVDTMTGLEVSSGTRKQDRNSAQLWRDQYTDTKGAIHLPKLIARTLPDNQDDPTPLADKVALLSRLAGNCIVALELNNSGLALVKPLQDRKVRLWKRQVFDEVTKKTTRKVGWVTGPNNRPLLLSEFTDLIRESGEDSDGSQGVVIPCSQLSRQCQTFVTLNGKLQAAPGEYDDDVIAAAIGTKLLKFATEYRAEEPEGERDIYRE